MFPLDLLIKYGTRAEKIAAIRHKLEVTRHLLSVRPFHYRAIVAMYLAQIGEIRRSITPT